MVSRVPILDTWNQIPYLPGHDRDEEESCHVWNVICIL
jgi:hypothetical protein